MTTARDDARERILRATVRALAEHGYAGTTARSIAAIGGFAPGVIYYHFADLDTLLMEVAAHSSNSRAERYRSELAGVSSAVDLIDRLRQLFDEDVASGHVAAVQELISAARPESALARTLAAQTRQWEQIGEEILRTLLRGTALARLFKIPVAAQAAVAYYLGMQTLTHLDGDTRRPEAAFRQAARLATAFDRLPKIRRRTTQR
jgi:AcrR family transcriptional regulator